MPTKKTKVIALFCSDMHWSLKPPPLRSSEPDWFKAMQRPLDFLKRKQEVYDCHIFCCGDLFDKWNSPPELINWAMKHSPYMHCIPGQHDLPEHDLKQIERSAYQTLVNASDIHDLDEIHPLWIHKSKTSSVHLRVTGYPYNVLLKPRETRMGDRPDEIHVAMIHQYNWIPGHGYHGAPDEARLHNERGEFSGYDVVFCGDNHRGFQTWPSRDTRFINCGSTMIRKTDEIGCVPSIWALYSNKDVERWAIPDEGNKYLDTSEAQKLEQQEVQLDLSGLVQELSKLGKCALDFMQAIRQTLGANPTRKAVRELLLRAAEDE